MSRPGRWFRFTIFLLLVGIFLELGAILSVLTGGGENEHGNIAVVELKDVIHESSETVASLKKYVKEEEVKAIVFRIDSPGGTVGASQEIHDAVITAVQKKPVVVSMGDLAASGGYYAAAPASKIVANPGTITGSIGVISYNFVLDDLLKRAHLKWEVIKAGEVKDIGSPLRSLTPQERKLLQDLTNDMHQQFMEAVAQGRKLPMDKVKVLATGRVFSGRQAKEVGLVDELGGLEKAIDVAAKLAHISGEPKVIYPEKERFGWIKRVAEGKVELPGMRVEYRLLR